MTFHKSHICDLFDLHELYEYDSSIQFYEKMIFHKNYICDLCEHVLQSTKATMAYCFPLSIQKYHFLIVEGRRLVEEDKGCQKDCFQRLSFGCNLLCVAVIETGSVSARTSQQTEILKQPFFVPPLVTTQRNNLCKRATFSNNKILGSH